MLEVIESYFSKISAELSLAEDECDFRYRKFTQENKVTKVSKEQDVKYNEQESANLKKSAGEQTSDRNSSNAKVSAMVR